MAKLYMADGRMAIHPHKICAAARCERVMLRIQRAAQAGAAGEAVARVNAENRQTTIQVQQYTGKRRARIAAEARSEREERKGVRKISRYGEREGLS